MLYDSYCASALARTTRQLRHGVRGELYRYRPVVIAVDCARDLQTESLWLKGQRNRTLAQVQNLVLHGFNVDYTTDS